MKIVRLLVVSTIVFLLPSCFHKQVVNKPIAIIPMPAVLEQHAGSFELKPSKGIFFENDSLRKLGSLVNTFMGVKNADTNNPKADVKLMVDKSLLLKDEGYTLDITNDGITIKGKTMRGLFYGVQTFFQLKNEYGTVFPLLHIKDEPRFAYRGMHLDVSRSFSSVAFVEKYIDLLAMYKMNTFHWHLTDGAGWRIEIKKYPLLTKKTAFRSQSTWKEFWASDRKFVDEGTPNANGGYYTQHQIRDIVAYAADRYVTIIPEIEMPAHSEEVFVAYPRLCCKQKAYAGSDFCVGNDSSFVFIQDVLTEVMDLFPSKYIHVAGDEAGKTEWKTCPLCKKRMKGQKLKNVDELQSYFMKRIETFVESRGRKIIGWDEILEGGLPPKATVMSWRGEKGGIKAAEQGHDVIMAPGKYCYLDAYQDIPSGEPEAIGGYLPLQTVYSYEPIPKELAAQYQKHILGIEGCLWTEYIPTEEHREYMLLPRMLALAEVAWSPARKKDWISFKTRLAQNLTTFERRGLNYHHPSNTLQLGMRVDQKEKQIIVKFDSEYPHPEIHYTLDGSTPTAASALYTDSIVCKGMNTLCAGIFINGRAQKPLLTKPIIYHQAIGKKVKYVKKWDGYDAGGEGALTDGLRGGFGYGDGRWQGFTTDMDVTIDLEKVTALHHFSATFMQITGPGVYMPSFVEVYTSTDGIKFKKVLNINNDVPKEKSELSFKDYNGDLSNISARYVRVFAKNPKGYIFTDELIVE